MGALGPIDTLPFDHKSGSPKSQSGLLPDIDKPPLDPGPKRAPSASTDPRSFYGEWGEPKSAQYAVTLMVSAVPSFIHVTCHP
jgi:hypothetical protein